MKQRSDRSNLAHFLKESRIAAGLSQAEVAKRLGYSSGQFVSNWERGLCPPPMVSLGKLVKILAIDPDEISELILEETRQHLAKAFASKPKKIRA